ncbi:MAG: PEGA domain-containing protein [Deltaproteobacteria bacterium]|nr:PEGA domain-containing protein [Deltaproteobacteria bacterium]
MTDALEAFQAVEVKKVEDLFTVEQDEAAEAALKRAAAGLSESKVAWESKEFDEAERRLRATLKEYAKAAGALRECGGLCEAQALYAAALHRRGDVDEARLAVMDLLALSPNYELPPRRFERDFVAFRTQVASSSTNALRGKVQIKSKPPGARVFVDNERMGYTPLTLDALAQGKHVVRVERPGHAVWSDIIEVSPDGMELDAELIPSDDYRSYDEQLTRAAGDVGKAKAGASLIGVGKQLGVDRALTGTLKELDENSTLELAVGYFDFSSGRRLGYKRITFQENEFGELRNEVTRLVNTLLNSVEAGSEREGKTSDPLDGKSGMEGWNADDVGGKSTATQKKKGKDGKDPLDTVNGTEGW